MWDGKTVGWLRDEEYRAKVVERIEAGSVQELGEILERKGLRGGNGNGDGNGGKERLVETVDAFNEEVDRAAGEREKSWNPAVKDGLGTSGIWPAKSNWALRIDTPPFLAVKVVAGITFTFGGLAVMPETARVVSERTGREIRGLYCVGEMLGGLYDNYPGGSGLMAETVFGRRAGRDAARVVKLPVSA